MNWFEIFLDQKREYRWRLKAANGEIVAVSEGYTTKDNCRYAVQLVQTISSTAHVNDLTATQAMYR